MKDGEEQQRQLLTIAVDASVSAFTPYDVQGDGPSVPIELALAAAGKVLLAAAEAGNWHVQCLAGMGGTHFRLQRLLGSVPLREDTVKPVLARVRSISAPRLPSHPAQSPPSLHSLEVASANWSDESLAA